MPSPTVNKPWYQSSTIIVNAIAVIILILQAANSVEIFGIGTDVQAIVVAILNILNRFRTTVGVTVK